jgi:hypothetical protein
VKTYVIDVNTSITYPEEGAHGPSWPNGLIVIAITIIIAISSSPSLLTGELCENIHG